MADARPWLPRTAFAFEAVQRALTDLVVGWSQDWFSPRQAWISAVSEAGSGALHAPEPLQVAGRFLTARLHGRGQRRLLEAAFGADLQGSRLNDADHDLLRAFATSIVEDLVNRIDTALDDRPPDDGDDRLTITLSAGDGELIELTCPTRSLTPLLKARIAKCSTDGSPLADRFVALASTSVTVEALLGEAVIGVEDLEGLAVGDVLVLDRPVGSSIELRLCGSKGLVGRGQLGRVHERVSVHF